MGVDEVEEAIAGEVENAFVDEVEAEARDDGDFGPDR
jgi:hypothetical protein